MLAIDLNVNPLAEPYVQGGKHIVELEKISQKIEARERGYDC